MGSKPSRPLEIEKQKKKRNKPTPAPKAGESGPAAVVKGKKQHGAAQQVQNAKTDPLGGDQKKR